MGDAAVPHGVAVGGVGDSGGKLPLCDEQPPRDHCSGEQQPHARLFQPLPEGSGGADPLDSSAKNGKKLLNEGFRLIHLSNSTNYMGKLNALIGDIGHGLCSVLLLQLL